MSARGLVPGETDTVRSPFPGTRNPGIPAAPPGCAPNAQPETGESSLTEPEGGKDLSPGRILPPLMRRACSPPGVPEKFVPPPPCESFSAEAAPARWLDADERSRKASPSSKPTPRNRMGGKRRTAASEAIRSPTFTGLTHGSRRLSGAVDPRCCSISRGAIPPPAATHVPATEIATITPAAIIPGRPPDPLALRLPPNFNPPPSLQGVETLNSRQPNRSYPFPHERRLKTLAVRPGNPVFPARKSATGTGGNEQNFCSLSVERGMPGVLKKR